MQAQIVKGKNYIRNGLNHLKAIKVQCPFLGISVFACSQYDNNNNRKQKNK